MTRPRASLGISTEDEMFGELLSAYHDWHHRFMEAYLNWANAPHDSAPRIGYWEAYKRVRDEWDVIESKYRRKN